MDWIFSIERVLPEPVSPLAELLPLFLRFARRGDLERRGDRPGLPDTEPFPFDPTTSSFETERELPYMTMDYAMTTLYNKNSDIPSQ